MYFSQGSVTLLITLALLTGCATEEELADYAINSAIDDKIESLNLLRIDAHGVEVIPAGQLISRTTAVFKSSDELFYLVELEKPLFAGYEGRAVSLDEPIIKLGHSQVRVARYSEREIERLKKSEFELTARDTTNQKSRVKGIYKLRNQEHAQKVADALQK